MFGKTPSSLDALVFGYLAPLLKAPLPSPQLQNHLRQCDNLVNLCNAVLNNYFSSEVKAYEEKTRTEEANRKTKSSDHADFPNRRRNMILAGVFALSCMIGYAISIGMIQVQVFDGEKPKGRQKFRKSVIKNDSE